MKEPPSSTFAHLLEGLYSIPGEFVACSEWHRLPADRMRRDIQTRRRHFFNKRVALVNYVAPESRPDEMLVDDSADATVKRLGDALTLLLRAQSQELGPTLDAVLETAVRRTEVSQKQAAEAYMLAEEHETNPRSIWGFVQGLTRLSQKTPWQDGRYVLDRAASRLLATVH